MEMPANTLWTATRIYMRGTKFAPLARDCDGRPQAATLRIERDGDIVYRSGGSNDPYRILPEQLADTMAGLSRPLNEVLDLGLAL